MANEQEGSDAVMMRAWRYETVEDSLREQLAAARAEVENARTAKHLYARQLDAARAEAEGLKALLRECVAIRLVPWTEREKESIRQRIEAALGEAEDG